MLSIIIPAHNEAGRIENTLKAYGTFFKDKKKNKEIDDFEVIVVANACKDNTVEVANKIGKKFKEIKILNFRQGGKGFAIKQGFIEALKSKAGLMGFIDADMATLPEYFYDLVKRIGKHDGIIASRYVKGSVIKPERGFLRGFLVSRTFNLLVRILFLFNFRDTQCGAKLFKRKAIEKVLSKLSISQWAFDIDLLYNIKKLGFRVKETPTFWRSMDDSKVNVKKASFQMFLAILQLRMLNSRLKRSWRLFKPLAGTLYRRVG